MVGGCIGCVGCSAWVPMNKLYPEALGSAAKNIPVAQFHGTRDEMVRFTWGQDRSVHSTQYTVHSTQYTLDSRSVRSSTRYMNIPADGQYGRMRLRFACHPARPPFLPVAAAAGSFLLFCPPADG